jgi:O-antigen/teichoic acid export membrane protein
MKKKFIRDISASSSQMIINQVSGLIAFYIISSYLDKSSFGEINWVLAVLLTAFNILSCGIDNVSIRKIASGSDAKSLLSINLWHVLFSGILFYGLLFASQLIFPGFLRQYHLLLLFGISRLLIFFSTPFKQLATGMEKFRLVMIMSICSTVTRAAGLLLLALLHDVTINTIIITFIISSIAELTVCLYITYKALGVPIRISWDKSRWLGLLKESFPQLGVVIFDAAIARFDWIFLGVLASAIVLADYSFAYKIFELSTLPMLIVAPLLIPRFTRLFKTEPTDHHDKINDLFIFIRLEMIIASLIALVMNICWVPVIDFITNGKYGAVNIRTVLILSASMPFLYMNNFLWTINFAQGKLKMIFWIITITFLINVISDLVLIPFFSAEGAAVAYLLAIIIQSFLYLKKTQLQGLKTAWYPLLVCPVCALASGIVSMLLFHQISLVLLTSLIIYIIALLLTKQIRLHDWRVFKKVIGI